MKRLVRTLCWLSLPALLALGATGCGKALFSPSEYRSQFDRFDAARGNYAEQYVEDAYGRRRPNIRGRLAPRD